MFTKHSGNADVSMHTKKYVTSHYTGMTLKSSSYMYNIIPVHVKRMCGSQSQVENKHYSYHYLTT